MRARRAETEAKTKNRSFGIQECFEADLNALNEREQQSVVQEHLLVHHRRP